jgi:sec-independent protein translocase protein TatB
MLDIAFTEILFISILALILLGPKELPVVLKTLGQWLGRLRRLSEGMQKHLYDLELEKEYLSHKKTQQNQRPPVFPDEEFKKHGIPLPSPHAQKSD